MHFGPALYIRRLFLQALGAWLLVRAIYVALALRAQLPDPVTVTPRSIVLLAALVAGVTWLDLRRRNLTILLPNLGVPVPAVLVGAAALTIVAELAVAAALP